MDVENRSSELGTKDYWDQAYDEELENFREDDDDVGNVWFGRACLRRVVKALEHMYPAEEDRSGTSILDIGTGNGVTLVELRKACFQRLSGIDYSEASIALADGVLKKEFGEDHGIVLKCVDFLDRDQVASLEGAPFHVCFDKGTYDALRLNPDVDPAATTKTYAENVKMLLKKPGGKLVLTSCNWTEEELVAHFGDYFRKTDTVSHSTFAFGGKTGSTCSTVVFELP